MLFLAVLFNFVPLAKKQISTENLNAVLGNPYEKYTCVTHVNLEQSHVFHMWIYVVHMLVYVVHMWEHVNHMWLSHMNDMWLFQIHMWTTCVTHVGFYMCIFRKGRPFAAIDVAIFSHSFIYPIYKMCSHILYPFEEKLAINFIS